MKAYTDLKQSAQLAILLPTESADMKYPYFGDGQYGTTALFGEPIEFSGSKDIPAWSLAALFKLLPKCIEGAEPSLIKTFRDDYRIVYDIHGDENITSEDYTNPIDACYEMIIRLKEKELI